MNLSEFLNQAKESIAKFEKALSWKECEHIISTVECPFHNGHQLLRSRYIMNNVRIFRKNLI